MSPPIRLLGLFELLAATALGLAACGGGSAGMGQLKMAVADAPVDGAQAVGGKVTGIELTGKGGNPRALSSLRCDWSITPWQAISRVQSATRWCPADARPASICTAARSPPPKT